MVEVLFYFVILLGVFMQTTVGLGAIISMPLGILLMGIGLAKPVITFIGLLTGLSVLATEYRYIQRHELIKMAGVMLIGVLAAMWIAGRVKMNLLLLFYAVVVIYVGVKGLFFPGKRQSSKAMQNAALIIAGIMQGLFVSGGSFLAVYAIDRLPDKRQFRATVNALWCVLNVFLLITYFIGGQMDKKVLTMSAIAIAPAVLGIYLGTLFAKRIQQQTFLRLVYTILIAAGIVLLITNL